MPALLNTSLYAFNTFSRHLSPLLFVIFYVVFLHNATFVFGYHVHI